MLWERVKKGGGRGHAVGKGGGNFKYGRPF